MKKTLLTLFAGLFITTSTFAQFEFGLQGAAATFWLTNKNVSGSVQTHTMSFSYNYGLHLGIDFTDHVGIAGDFYMGHYSQSYSGTFPDSGKLYEGMTYYPKQSYTSTVTFKTMDIPVAIRFSTNSGAFVEVGVQYSITSSVNYSASYSSPGGSYSGDVSSTYASSNLQGIFGFGSNFRLNDQWFILTDFRFLYGFTDVKGVDALGQDLNNSWLYAGSNPYYSSYQPTHTITGSFSVGIYYYLETNFTHKTGHQRCKGPARARG